MEYQFKSGEKILMRNWLENNLNSGEIPGLQWVQKEEKIFKIKWTHGSRRDWDLTDTDIFKKWAQHTGRLEGCDTVRWKANFRCAINSLKDVIEEKELSTRSGSNAYRVYRMIDKARTDPERSEERKCNKGKRLKRNRTSQSHPPPNRNKLTEGNTTHETIPSNAVEAHSGIKDGNINPHSAVTDDEFRILSLNDTFACNRETETDSIYPSKFEYGKPFSLPKLQSGFIVDALESPTPPGPLLERINLDMFVGEIQSLQTQRLPDAISSREDIPSESGQDTSPIYLDDNDACLPDIIDDVINEDFQISHLQSISSIDIEIAVQTPNWKTSF